jgi:methyl-accepting chemotaxis protein
MASEASSTSQQAAAVKRSADAARQAAERGAAQMREVGAAMASQQQASAQITQILRTIDGIAFQTNILALNAAVEAARAGGAGAGFAVVAGEVRDLAQRVAQAARDTSEKVEDAAQKSTRGAAIIQEAAVTFDDIESQVRDVDTLMASLTEASNQQATTARHVTTSISQMNEVVTASARSAVNAAHASQALAAEAAQLNESFEALGALLGDNRRRSASPGAAAASRASANASALAA